MSDNDKMQNGPQQVEVADKGNGADVRPYIQQVALKTLQLGQLALDLFQQGQLSHPALEPLCVELLQLEQQLGPAVTPPPPATAVTDGDDTLFSLPTVPPQPAPAEETAVAPPPPPTPTSDQCPNCHKPILAGKKFCTSCGYRLIPPEEAATAPPAEPAPIANPQTVQPEAPLPTNAPPSSPTCPQCHAPLEPEAIFCIQCGHKVGDSPIGQFNNAPPEPASFPHPNFPDSPPAHLPTPYVPAGPITKYCDNCGKGLSEEITVCPDCQSTQFAPA